MKINDEYIVKVEKMVNEGRGLARIDDFPLFINDVAPQDKLKVRIVNLNKNYAVADIVEIITPSKFRVKPICSMYNVCGSCNWQHIDYCEQLNQKNIILCETLKNITGCDFPINKIIPSPKVEKYRHKVQYPVAQKKSGRIISGYFKKSSHELVNIKYCPMHEFEINLIMEFIKEHAQVYDISGYNEKTHQGLLRHVVFRQSSYDKKILVVFVLNKNEINKNLKKLADALISRFPQISGICANFNTKKSNVILGEKTTIICGNDFYMEKLSDIVYKISSTSFFQINPYSAEIIFNIVKELIASNLIKPSILDAYSGVSSFGVWLCSIASKVVCVEEVISSTKDAECNIKLNNANNIEIINGDAAITFTNFMKNNKRFDVVLIDPPRKGSSEKALKQVISLAKEYIIYVSCNPATLARDLKYLIKNNFMPEYVQPVDMFPNTSHIETIVMLKNCNKKDAL